MSEPTTPRAPRELDQKRCQTPFFVKGIACRLCASSSTDVTVRWDNDRGDLDEVLMVQSPPTVAAAVQRVGRAGHAVGAVSRGRLYPLFGRDLLRSALRRDVEQRLDDFAPGRELPLPDRYERFLRTAVSHRQAIVLGLLLVLDGDKAVRMVPDPEGVCDRLARDVEEGKLPGDVDAVGLHAALASLVYGYTVLRDRLADELGAGPGQLDEKVASAIARLLSRVAADPDPAPA